MDDGDFEAMKVILTAFQGKLRSEPMDFPEPPPFDIRMRLDLEKSTVLKPMTPNDKPLIETMCRFEATGKHFVLEGSKTATEYRLVGMKS